MQPLYVTFPTLMLKTKFPLIKIEETNEVVSENFTCNFKTIKTDKWNFISLNTCKFMEIEWKYKAFLILKNVNEINPINLESTLR